MTCKEWTGNSHWLSQGNIQAFAWRACGKLCKACQDTWCLVRDSNRGLAKYEAGVLITQPWCSVTTIFITDRVFLQKFLVTWLVKKFPAFCGTWKFISMFIRSLPVDPILSYMIPVHTLTPYSLRFILILLHNSKLVKMSKTFH